MNSKHSPQRSHSLSDSSFRIHIGWGLVGCGVISSLLVGCGMDSDSLAAIENAARQQSQITASFDDEVVTPIRYQPAINGVFQPAFPDRRDPFRIDKVDIQQDEIMHASSDIRVVGFAKLGEQQAILKIGDESKFVVVGDRIGDVEVLSISPPRVRLRSGKLTWDASMFQNQSLGSAGLNQD